MKIQANHAFLATLMLTACNEPRLATQAITYGAWNYLIKPVCKEELLFQVSRVLERRQFLLASRAHTLGLEHQVNQQTQMIRMANEEVIHRLVVASMVRDDETGAHIKRIGLFSAAVAEAAGWSQEEVENIRLASPMHDIGKIGIPDAILLKPGKLSAEEYETMKTHTLIGANILRNSHSPMMRLAEQIARSHHEWWDGGGYPEGLSGEAIPAAARIVAIVDVYDALSHDRVYRPAMSEPETLAIINQGRGTHFDPQLLDIFLKTLPIIRELSKVEEDYEPADCGVGTTDALAAFKQESFAAFAMTPTNRDPMTHLPAITPVYDEGYFQLPQFEYSTPSS